MEKRLTSEQKALTPERVRELGSRLKAILELNGEKQLQRKWIVQQWSDDAEELSCSLVIYNG